MPNSMVTILFAVLGLTVMIEYSNAKCCHECAGEFWGYCYDCTDAKPYCGKGSCNLFGCNCVGGCREPTDPLCEFCSKTFQVTDAQGVFAELDSNGDRNVSLLEATDWLQRRDLYPGNNLHEVFKAMDRNGDDFLSLDEVDV